MGRRDEGALKTVGWGPIALPGERRRLRDAEAKRLQEVADAAEVAVPLKTAAAQQTEAPGVTDRLAVSFADMQATINTIGEILESGGSRRGSQRAEEEAAQAGEPLADVRGRSTGAELSDKLSLQLALALQDPPSGRVGTSSSPSALILNTDSELELLEVVQAFRGHGMTFQLRVAESRQALEDDVDLPFEPKSPIRGVPTDGPSA